MCKKSFSTMAAIAAIALSLTTSCSKNEPEITGEQVELRLSSGVEVQTRSAFPSSDTQIPSGQTVSVWVDEAGGTPQMYGNNVLTANGSGGFAGTPMYFPPNGNDVDIYAIHTNAALTTAYPSALTHTVSGSQTALAGYASSDLLYAKATDVAKSSSAVQLTFYHLLSKLQVAIVAGNGLSASDISGVTIGGTKLNANFTLAKSTAPNAVAVAASGTVTNIAVGADVSTNFTTGMNYNDAIIVPQVLAAGTAFITVHLAAGADLVYNLPSAVTFESGKKYAYQITANLTGITLTSTITNWTPVGAVTGTAEMQ